MSQPQSLHPESVDPIEPDDDASALESPPAAPVSDDLEPARSNQEGREEHPAFANAALGTEKGTAAPPEVGSEAPRSGGKRWKLLSILLILGLLLCLAQILQQTRRINGLQAEVVALNGELAKSRQLNTAYETRMGEIREEVEGLVQGLGALLSLVDRDVSAVTPESEGVQFEAVQPDAAETSEASDNSDPFDTSDSSEASGTSEALEERSEASALDASRDFSDELILLDPPIAGAL